MAAKKRSAKRKSAKKSQVRKKVLKRNPATFMVPIANPTGTTEKSPMARKKRKTTKKKAHKKNPARRRRHSAKTAAPTTHKRRRARRHVGAAKRKTHRRARRRNPSMDPMIMNGLGAIAGLATGVIVNIARIQFASANQGLQYGIAGIAGLGGLFLSKKYPAIGVGIATGALDSVAQIPLTAKAMNLLTPANPAATTQGWSQIAGMQELPAPRIGAVIAENMGGVSYDHMGSVSFQNMVGPDRAL